MKFRGLKSRYPTGCLEFWRLVSGIVSARVASEGHGKWHKNHMIFPTGNHHKDPILDPKSSSFAIIATRNGGSNLFFHRFFGRRNSLYRPLTSHLPSIHQPFPSYFAVNGRAPCCFRTSEDQPVCRERHHDALHRSHPRTGAQKLTGMQMGETMHDWLVV